MLSKLYLITSAADADTVNQGVQKKLFPAFGTSHVHEFSPALIGETLLEREASRNLCFLSKA